MLKDRKKIKFYGREFFECDMCDSTFAICKAYMEITIPCNCGLCENHQADDFLNNNQYNNKLDYYYEEY